MHKDMCKKIASASLQTSLSALCQHMHPYKSDITWVDTYP